MEKMFVDVNDIKDACCCSKQKAYLIIREGNQILSQRCNENGMHYLIQQGKLPRKFFMEMLYGEG